MLKLMCILTFLTVINTGLCLKCYDCLSDKEDGCLRQSKPQQMRCFPPNNNTKPACYYKELRDPGKNKLYIEACCDWKDNPKYCSKSELEKKQCRMCYTDLCNSSSGLSTSFFVFLFAFIVRVFNRLFVN